MPQRALVNAREQCPDGSRRRVVGWRPCRFGWHVRGSHARFRWRNRCRSRRAAVAVAGPCTAPFALSTSVGFLYTATNGEKSSSCFVEEISKWFETCFQFPMDRNGGG
ncbi:MAG: hypothetical protein AW12_01110 [Candidatus Accumulibacter sp. BA-94]|nr:MAG: hypothetical protein AW12_01110 [Candidatus Accumulibacter sp. BA-94]